MLRNVFYVVTIFFLGLSGLNAQTLDEARELFNQGAEAKNAGNDKEALQYFQDCLDICEELSYDGDELRMKVEPLIPVLHYNIAMDHAKSKNYDQALKKMNTAKEVAEEYGNENIENKVLAYLPQLHYAMGGTLLKQKDLANAEFHYKKAIELDQTNHKAYYYLAYIAKKRGNNQQMIDFYKKVIELEDKNDKFVKSAKKSSLAYFLKAGQKAVSAKNYEEAAQNFESALQYGAEDDKNVQYYLAVSYNGLEKYSEAVDAAKKSIELETGSEESKAKAYYELGKAHAGAGNTQEACDAYGNAMYGNFKQAAEYQRTQVLKCK